MEWSRGLSRHGCCMGAAPGSQRPCAQCLPCLPSKAAWSRGAASARQEAGCRQPWPKTLILVRHGESAYNVHYQAHGSDPLDLWDAPLTQRGEQQARAAAQALAAHGVDLALTSPLSRAVQTCLLALPTGRGTRYEVSPLLAEHLEASCDLGRPPAELAADFPQLDFGGLAEVWWYVPEEERAGATPARSRELFAVDGRREPRSAAERRVDAFAAGLAGCAERTVAAFGHADFFNMLLARHFSRREGRFAEYWMQNCEVLPLHVAEPADLLNPQVAEAQVPADEGPTAPPPAAAPSIAASAAVRGLAALKQQIAAVQPGLAPAQLQREAARRWRELAPDERAALMSAPA